MELQLQHLSKCYGAKQAVNDVSTVLTPGVYGLLGANGAGKTTLMRMICGVLKPTSGSICLNGKSIDELGEDYYAHLCLSCLFRCFSHQTEQRAHIT